MTTILDALIAFMFIEIIFVVWLTMITKLGGWPAGFYRLFGIRFFIAILIDTDGIPLRHILRWSKMQIKSPQHFTLLGRTYYTDTNNTARIFGKPAWYYRPGNSIPIPIITGEQDEKIVDPLTIYKAYNIDIERRILNLRKPPSAKGSKILLVGLAILAIIILIGIIGSLGLIKS